jgi:hypothetical protein
MWARFRSSLRRGLRIGDGIAPEAIRKKLVIVKQGPDLQTSTFNQALAAEYLPGGHRQRHQPCVLALYGPPRGGPRAIHWSGISRPNFTGHGPKGACACGSKGRKGLIGMRSIKTRSPVKRFLSRAIFLPRRGRPEHQATSFHLARPG